MCVCIRFVHICKRMSESFVLCRNLIADSFPNGYSTVSRPSVAHFSVDFAAPLVRPESRQRFFQLLALPGAGTSEIVRLAVWQLELALMLLVSKASASFGCPPDAVKRGFLAVWSPWECANDLQQILLWGGMLAMLARGARSFTASTTCSASGGGGFTFSCLRGVPRLERFRLSLHFITAHLKVRQLCSSLSLLV